MKKSTEMAFRGNAGRMSEAVKDFDALGHLDYVVRYGIPSGSRNILIENYSDEIDEILKKLIAEGKGLEMNMAGIKIRTWIPAHPHPDVSETIPGAWWGDHHESGQMPMSLPHVAYEI